MSDVSISMSRAPGSKLPAPGSLAPAANEKKRKSRAPPFSTLNSAYLTLPPYFLTIQVAARWRSSRKGGDRMKIYEALSLMIAFGTLIAIIISLVIMLVK